MTALGVVILEALCCLGLGAAGLRAFGIGPSLAWSQKFAWSFVLGFGILGWLLFFLGVAGLFSPVFLLIVLSLGASGIILLRSGVEFSPPSLGFIDLLLIFGIAAALFFDLLEALSPPGDADSLAYHFALPKQFLQTGRIEFVPRAIDGAVPLLVQMTYIPALGLGGEKALTLWTMLSGWGVGLFAYVLCRKHLDRRLSAAIALILLTTPAVLYGGG